MARFQPRMFVVYRGAEVNLSEACRRAGNIVNKNVAWIRLVKCHWSVDDAVETPVGGKPRHGSGLSDVRRIDEEKLRQLWPSRLPGKILAYRMGHSLSGLAHKARKLGLPPRRVIWAREELGH